MNLRLWLVSIISFFLLLGTSACSTKTTVTLPENTPYTTYKINEVPPQVQVSAKEMKQQKIRNNDTTPSSTLFYTNNTNYVLITSGWKPTGGYTIRINRVSLNANAVTIYASDIAPEKDAMVEQVISAPLIVLSVTNDAKHVRLVWENH